jgi:Na+/melibiose symporter-like transporter
MKKLILLSFLFAIDAFAAGFIAQSFLAYFLQTKFDLEYQFIGSVLSVCSVISAISGLFSTKLVKRIGCMPQ